MGRPKDAKERQWQRAAEDVDRALRRKDAPGAAEHLLVLPKERRVALLPQVVALFRADVQRAYAAGDLGKLSKWVVWAEMEPRLLEGQDPGVLWPLVLGAARTRDWQRAQRMFAALEPDVQRRAPALHDWLGAWIEHRGVIPPDLAGPQAQLKRLPVRVSAAQPDPRLGYEPARKTAAQVAAPKSAQDVAQAVLRLFATERRPPLLRDTLNAWLRQAHGQPTQTIGPAGPSVKAALALHAVPLLVREALLLRRDGRPATVPLLAIGELMPAGDFAPAELAGDVSMALRLASTGLQQGEPAKAAPPQEALSVLLVVAGIAARYQEHRQVVADRLVRTQIPKESLRQAVPLLRELLGRCPAPALLAQSMRVWSGATAEDADLPVAPEWLAQGLAQVLGQGDALMAWLRRAGSTERNQLLMVVGLSMPVALGEQVLERAFAGEGPDDDSRRDLARLLLSLLGRRDTTDMAAAARAQGINPERATFGDLRDLLLDLDEQPPPEMMALIFSAPRKARLPRDLWPIYTAMALAASDDQPMLMSRAQRGLIERFGEQLVPYHTDLLRMALKQAQDRARKLRMIEVYLLPRKDIEARLEVLRALCCQRCAPELFPQVEEGMVTDFAGDAQALSRAFQRLQFFDASLQTARRVARALLDADANYKGPRTVEYEATLRAAEQIVPRQRRTGPRAKATKPQKAAKPAKAPEPKPAKAKPAKAADSKPPKGAKAADSKPPKGAQAAGSKPPKGAQAAGSKPPKGAQAAGSKPPKGAQAAGSKPPKGAKAADSRPSPAPAPPGKRGGPRKPGRAPGVSE